MVTRFKLIDYLNNVKRGASKYFRIKKKEYLKAEIDKRETNSKIKISETCTGTSVTLRSVTSPELIKQRLRKVIHVWLQNPAEL
jgi:hypothetical protein